MLATVVPLDDHQTHQITTTTTAATTTPLALLTACCSDEDPSTRKFACFAIGNAAFHSDHLYPSLANSIAPLALASETEADEKTR